MNMCRTQSISVTDVKSLTAAGGDISQQMLAQMVYTRDVNQLSSPAELDLTLVIKNLLP